MAKQTEKINILESAGYRYNFDRMMYINRSDRKAFSVEFIDDNPPSKLADKIKEPKVEPDWKFYTNSVLSESTKKELTRVLQ